MCLCFCRASVLQRKASGSLQEESGECSWYVRDTALSCILTLLQVELSELQIKHAKVCVTNRPEERHNLSKCHVTHKDDNSNSSGHLYTDYSTTHGLQPNLKVYDASVASATHLNALLLIVCLICGQHYTDSEDRKARLYVTYCDTCPASSANRLAGQSQPFFLGHNYYNARLFQAIIIIVHL